jgi:hypothetical protein
MLLNKVALGTPDGTEHSGTRHCGLPVHIIAPIDCVAIWSGTTDRLHGAVTASSLRRTDWMFILTDAEIERSDQSVLSRRPLYVDA